MTMFTDEWRSKRWKPCRFGRDPRDCGSAGRATDCLFKDGEHVCLRDQKLCDACWEGPKE